MKFGVREICDVTFKSTDERMIGTKKFAKYQPVFMIDTAQTSEMTQESTSVYAQGGKGYNRLIAWEGEKQMTFKVTDALMSPMGLAILTSAGLIKADDDNTVHVHTLIQKTVSLEGTATIDVDDLNEELGTALESINVCGDAAIKIYGTVVDGSGAGIDWIDAITVAAPEITSNGFYVVDAKNPLVLNVEGHEGQAVVFDLYVGMKDGATQIDIKPGDFGGFFYVEADTLFRREDTGADMAAVLTFPKVKIQSGFTFSMAATGDPSTFDFVMDAFPAYTQFDHNKKVCVSMSIVGADKNAEQEVEITHLEEKDEHSAHAISAAKVAKSKISAGAPYDGNQDKITVSEIDNVITIKANKALDKWESSDSSQASADGTGYQWMAIDIDTKVDDITTVKWNGSALTSQDVADAAACGLGAGHLVYWAKAEDFAGGKTKKITLTYEDGNKLDIIVKMA